MVRRGHPMSRRRGRPMSRRRGRIVPGRIPVVVGVPGGLSPRRIPVRIPVEVGVPGGLSPRRIPSPGPSITGVVAIVPICVLQCFVGKGQDVRGKA